MSDTTTTPTDAAIEALRDRVAQLDADIQAHTRRLEVATACRDELLEMIAMLGRKGRVTRRAPRLERTAPPATVATAADAPGPIVNARPSVFSLVPSADREAIGEAV